MRKPNYFFRALCIAFCAVCLLSGCHASSLPEESAASIVTDKPIKENPLPISLEDIPDGEVITILTEANFLDSANLLLKCYYQVTGENPPPVQFITLPEDAEEREARISALKTEIMSGNGPDGFLLAAHSTYDPDYSSFFGMPTTAMRFRYFLSLNDLINESEIINPSQLNTEVFDAGKLGNVQFVLPVLYTISVAAVDSNLDSTAIPSSWQETVNCTDQKLKSTLLYAASNYPQRTFSDLTDESGENLAFTQEKLQNRLEEILDNPGEGYGRLGSTSELNLSLLDGLSKDKSQPHTLVPLRNEEGGITANVTAFAAINANTKYPRAVFSVFELLFREELISGTGFYNPTDAVGNDGTVIGNYLAAEFYSNNMPTLAYGISVMDEAFLDGNTCSLSSDDRESLKEICRQVSSAWIASQIDCELANATVQIVGAGADSKKTVQSTYTTLQMLLAES